MLIDLFVSLPKNIYNNFNYLQSDFVGFTLDKFFFTNILISLIISLGLIFISYIFGEKIRNFLLKNKDFIEYDFLISIAFGYIFISSGIAILGFFSLLRLETILLYLAFILLLSISPISFVKESTKNLINDLSKVFKHFKSNKFVFSWIIFFILLASVNLINPETREDQYHVDLPKKYLQNQTIMIPPLEPIHVSGSTLLSEMYYSIGIAVRSNETARYIHFMFYILTLITLISFSKINVYKFSIYTPLIFATAPVVIKETSSVYVDFQWVFLFLLSILVLLHIKKVAYPAIIISGIFLGGMLATKLWTIAFIPVSTLYLLFLLKQNKIKTKKIIKFIVLFIIAIVIVSGMWFLRAYVLTGNPLYPAFLNEVSIENTRENFSLYHYIRLNYPLFNPFSYINVFSPLFFLGCMALIYKIRKNISIILNLNFFKYFIFLFIVYAFINYPYGRYLLGLYVLFIFLSSIGINNLLKFKYLKSILNFLLLIFYSYYFINSILTIPYALGFADKNKYLSRILIRDNSSYFDFGGKFNKYILKRDLVATYQIFGYYYADFNYIDVNFIFDKNHRSFNLFKEKGVTKLFIKGGNINYLCKRINLKDCDSSKYSFVSSYLEYPTYFLYDIKE